MPCSPISNQWCYAIAVTDGFVFSLGILQCYQVILIHCSLSDIIGPLKKEHQIKVEQKKDRKSERKWKWERGNSKRREAQRRAREDEAARREQQRQARQYKAHPQRPEKAYAPGSDYTMDDMRLRGQHCPQSYSRHHETPHGRHTETGRTTIAEYQSTDQSRRRNDGNTPSHYARSGQSAQRSVYSSNDQRRPGPASAFTHSSAPYPHHYRLPSNTGQQRQVPGRTKGKRKRARPRVYPEDDVVSDHRHHHHHPIPRSHHRSASPRSGPPLLPSVPPTATGASSPRRLSRIREGNTPTVSAMSSEEDLRRHTPHQREICAPSPYSTNCSANRLSVVPSITVTTPDEETKPIASRASSNLSRISGHSRTSAPRDDPILQYGRWVDPDDDEYSALGAPSGIQASASVIHTVVDDNERGPPPGPLMTEPASPPPYEREADSKVWGWMMKG